MSAPRIHATNTSLATRMALARRRDRARDQKRLCALGAALTVAAACLLLLVALVAGVRLLDRPAAAGAPVLLAGATGR